MSSSWRRIIAVKRPFRRCVLSTPTRVTPAQGRTPPGTVISYEKIPAVATISGPSKNASVRSNSVMPFETSSPSSVGNDAPKARRITADERTFSRQPLRQLDIDSRRMRPSVVGIQECFLVIGPRIPAGAVQQPAALRKRAMLPLERADIVQGQ